jgi:hypothetical protein
MLVTSERTNVAAAAELRGDRGGVAAGAPGDQDLGAAARQGARGGQPDAVGAAEDHGLLARVHVSFSRRFVHVGCLRAETMA